MKKYTPVFGPQELFDGAANCDEYLVAVQHSVGQKTKVSFYPSLVEAFNYVVDFPPRGVVFHRAAMRRIEEMQEPKRWTWEDKKAGRLPVVGAEVQFNFYQSAVMRQGVIKYIDDQVAVIQTEDVTRPFCYETCKVVFTPIETPEEKAERLRSEWCSECTSKYYPRGHKGFPEMIYDALLSGALSAPTKGGE